MANLWFYRGRARVSILAVRVGAVRVSFRLPCAHHRKGAGVGGKGAGVVGGMPRVPCVPLVRLACAVGACAVPCAPLRAVGAPLACVVVDGAPLRGVRCRCCFASLSWHAKPWPPSRRALVPFRGHSACRCTLTPAPTVSSLARCTPHAGADGFVVGALRLVRFDGFWTLFQVINNAGAGDQLIRGDAGDVVAFLDGMITAANVVAVAQRARR